MGIPSYFTHIIKNHSNIINHRFEKELKSYIKKLKLEKPKLATRQSSLQFLNIVQIKIIK